MTQVNTPQDNNEGVTPEPQPHSVASFNITAKQTTVTFRGHVPPPEILRAYNLAIPNGGERIMSMAEGQSAHRQSLERTVIESNATVQKFGVGAAFVITLTALILGFFLILYDKNFLGFSLMLTCIGSLVGTFIYGRRSQERERSEKAKPFLDED